jgi:GNAT superfamily N-acetyltransferase
MSAKVDFDIRYSEIEDGEYLKNWLLETENQKWFPMSLPQEIEDSSKNWIGFARYKASLTATVDGKPCGIATLFLMPYKKVAHHAMFYLIVDKPYRRRGIGSSLIKNILNLGKTRFRLESVHAEVFNGCAILPLLKKLHFLPFAYQELYVKDGEGYLARTLLEHFFEGAP